MADRAIEREQRVTPLEPFFDLVVVFAITQVTELMSSDLTWGGVGRGLLVFAAIWWSWTGYAWLTNALEPEEGLVRAGMFAAMAAMFVVALAVPSAFGSEGVLFGVAYVFVRLINIGLYAFARKGHPEVRPALARLVPSTIVGPSLPLLCLHQRETEHEQRQSDEGQDDRHDEHPSDARHQEPDKHEDQAPSQADIARLGARERLPADVPWPGRKVERVPSFSNREVLGDHGSVPSVRAHRCAPSSYR